MEGEGVESLILARYHSPDYAAQIYNLYFRNIFTHTVSHPAAASPNVAETSFDSGPVPFITSCFHVSLTHQCTDLADENVECR